MKIKRTDGRPVVIHTKEKPKLHVHRTNAAVNRTEKPQAHKTAAKKGGGSGNKRAAKRMGERQKSGGRTGSGIKSRRTFKKGTADLSERNA